MANPLVSVLGLLAVAIVMFARGTPPMHAVALLVMAALPFTGTVSVPEALAGFADQSVILIGALFVIGEALVRTGVAQWLGVRIAAAAGGSAVRLTVLLMAAAAGLGSFMSSTGVVAIFIPIVLRIAGATGIPVGRLMMPLSMAALISGMMTLVATAPNMVINAELIRRGHEGFGFFAFTPFGLPVLALAVLYVLAVRRHMGGGGPVSRGHRPGMKDWVEDYGLAAREVRLRLGHGSDLAGRRLDELNLRASSGVNIVAIERPAGLGRRLLRPEAHTVLDTGDVLLLDILHGGFDAAAFRNRYGLDELPLSGAYFMDGSQEIGLAEAVVPPGSALNGKTLVQAGFRSLHDLAVIAVKRRGTPLAGPAARLPLEAGDTLLMVGPWRAIRRLDKARHDLLLLDLPEEADDYAPARARAPYAVAVLLAVIAVMAGGWLPNAQAAIIGCLALGLFGCIDTPSAYRSIHWPTLILIVGMLPFALALERTGAVGMAADAIVATFGGSHPRVMLAVLFAATAALGLFISNTATAVLMGPVALAIAEGVGASPYPFAMAVALGASTAFMTPVSSPVNTLVAGPGEYRFGDFVRIGVPFSLLTMGAVVVLVPMVLPF